MIFDVPIAFDEAARSRRVRAFFSESDIAQVGEQLPILRRRACATAARMENARMSSLMRVFEEAESIPIADATVLLRGLFANERNCVIIGGLAFEVENPKGSVRTGTDADGNAWAVVMPADYGYVRNVEGADGDELDAFLGDATGAPRVWVADMVDPLTGEWDEHKCFVGFKDEATVRETLQAAYSDGAADRLAGLREMGLDEFAVWIRDGRRKVEPIDEAANQQPTKHHVIPDFRERMVQLRHARQHDFSEFLDRVAHIGTLKSAGQMLEAVNYLKDDLADIGDKAMRNGREAKIVAAMLAEAFTRTLTDGSNPKRIIRHKQKPT